MSGTSKKQVQDELAGMLGFDSESFNDLLRDQSFDIRSKYECDVCGNVPDEDGTIEHGRGCLTQDEDGGGTSSIDFDEEDKKRLNAIRLQTKGETSDE